MANRPGTYSSRIILLSLQKLASRLERGSIENPVAQLSAQLLAAEPRTAAAHKSQLRPRDFMRQQELELTAAATPGSCAADLSRVHQQTQLRSAAAVP